MPSKQTKAGLILAIVLGVSDLLILIPFLTAGAGDDKPPGAIVAISLVIGVITIGAAVMAMSKPTRALLMTVLVTRIISGLGDLTGMGEDAAVVTISLVLLAVTVGDVYLLRSWFKKPIPTASAGGI